jgi:DNA invertase Pin-like site-specific DNA recombinase
VTDRSGHWLRVSTKLQDEASQEPDEIAWSDSHGYEVTRTYTIHGGSAHKGNAKFDKAWAAVLEDFRTGVINVLVVWYLSRLDRKLEATKMIAEVVALGGRASRSVARDRARRPAGRPGAGTGSAY